jgi:hypothetical protein
MQIFTPSSRPSTELVNEDAKTKVNERKIVFLPLEDGEASPSRCGRFMDKS